MPLKTMLEHSELPHILCLSNSRLMTKLKELNDLNKIIYEKSFNDLLKLNNIFS